jgi:hypothetical protein
MFTRFALGLASLFVLAALASAADLPTGTWAVNLDNQKGEFTVSAVKDGKFTGVFLGTDVSGTWDGKQLAFLKAGETFEAFLLNEPGDKGKVKYTLTGVRSREVRDFTTRAGTTHVVKLGWYAQLTADAPVPTGELTATVRGVLTVEKASASILVKRKIGSAIDEVKIALVPADWNAVKERLAALNGQEVIVTGTLQAVPVFRNVPFGLPAPADRAPPDSGLSVVGTFDIKPAK